MTFVANNDQNHHRGWELAVHYCWYIVRIIAQPSVALLVHLLVLNENFLVREKSQESSAISLQIVEQGLCLHLPLLHRCLVYQLASPEDERLIAKIFVTAPWIVDFQTFISLANWRMDLLGSSSIVASTSAMNSSLLLLSDRRLCLSPRQPSRPFLLPSHTPFEGYKRRTFCSLRN